MIMFEKVCKDVTKTARKIPQSEYQKSGDYKIFDQGKEYIGGYTNDSTGIVNDFPYIVFGDHTRVIKYIDEPCFIGADGVKLLKVFNQSFYPKYVYYSFLSNPVANLGYSRHFKFLKETAIRECDLNSQYAIVNDLDNINYAISIAKCRLLSLEELVKSRFIEMFIDKSFPYEFWGNVVSIINGKDYKKVPNNNQTYPIYGSGGYMGIRCDKYICKEFSTIIGRKGNVTNPIFVKEKFWNVDTAFGIEVKEKLNPYYFYQYTLTIDLASMVSGAAIPSLTKSDLLKLQIPVPPIELQNEFAEFVKLIDKSKFVYQVIQGTFYVKFARFRHPP